MKSSMTNFDVFAVSYELRELRGARLNKVYQVSPHELKVVLNIKGFGKRELVIEAGKRLHLTDYPKPSPTTPSVFAMTLRKYLVNAVLEDVSQVAFDRIMELRFKRGDEGYVLVAELFGKGNILLTKENYRILAVMRPQRFKARALVGKETYSSPPQKLNPFAMSAGELVRAVEESKSDLIRTLASGLGLGGLYAEELCLRVEVEKGREVIDEDEAAKLLKVLHELKKVIGCEAFIVFDKEPMDVVPHRLFKYADKEAMSLPSFNQALDEYYTKYEVTRIEGVRDKKYTERLGLYESRLADQRDAHEKFTTEVKKYRELGDLIYGEFNQVKDIIRTLSEAKRSLKWKEIIEKIEEGRGQSREADLIKKILPKEGALIVALGGNRVRLDIKKTAAQNADFYYKKSKKARDKIVGVEKAIVETEAKIRGIKEDGKKSIIVEDGKPKKRVKRKKEWYEKFRWFVSSYSFLVLGGRDATSNEVLVKKHMSADDIFVHADIHGAPAVIVKAAGKSIPESTIDQAYDFAASYSKAWKHNLAALDVYWVTPEQVSKSSEHGEFIAKGGFVVRGKRNVGKGKVELGIGVQVKGEDFMIIAAPLSAITKTAAYWVKLVPGRLKSKETAEKIKALLIETAKEDDKKKIEGIALTDFQAFLPSGGCEVLRRS